jgi:putative nucleotidyltransferase with HDIG domain
MNHIQSEYIPTGRFRVGKKSPQKFQAILGTCLGLALYDPKRKAGGLIHILLPSPLGNTDFQSESPEKYASTGIPMLINELTRIGCTTQTLKATIAGGALVGPVSSMDLGLDIGGRSTDIARRILKEQGIEIFRSETGGFFACTLELNMMTGETKIAPVWETGIAPGAMAPIPGPEAIMATIENLQPIPQTALKILRMFNQDSYSVDDVIQELSQDQVLSARTLQMCNTVLFSGTIKIDSLKDAVMMLGKERLAKSVITTAIESYFNQTGPSGYSLCKGGLFSHAVGVACLSERLAKETGFSHPWPAYTAGLLHDIGKVVLDQHISEFLPFFYRTLGNEKQSILQSEEKVLGFDHCRAGVILAEKWGFSDALTEVIRCHHTPEDAKVDSQLVEIVYLADRIMEKFFAGFDIDNIDALHLEPIIKKMNLDGPSLARYIDDLPLDILIQEPPHGTTNT